MYQKKRKKTTKKKDNIEIKRHYWTIVKTYEREIWVNELLEILKKDYKKKMTFSQLVFDLIEQAYHDPSILIKSQSTSDLEQFAEEIFTKQKEEQNETITLIKNLENKIDRLEKLIIKENES